MISYKNLTIYHTFRFITSLLIIFFVLGCETNKPIKIGFVGGLTGRHYDLSVSGRNGAMLAVEETNKKGGINGRKIELIVKDDKNDPEVAVKVDRELIDEGVIAIVGHMTSHITKAALPLINEKRVLMISPTVASPIFDKIDDFFIKASPSLTAEALNIADFAVNNKKIKKIAVIYNLSNKAYSEEWLLRFKSNFERLGGKVIASVGFNSNENPSFARLAHKALASSPHGIVIIANALDTAIICQQIRKINSNVQLFSSLWGMTTDILRHGGSAVENLVFSPIHNPTDTTQAYIEFKKNYTERFGREPDFAAIKSYDSINIILSVIQETQDMTDIKKAILKKKKFKGIQGDFEINEYGDVQLKLFLIAVKDNKFILIQ